MMQTRRGGWLSLVAAILIFLAIPGYALAQYRCETTISYKVRPPPPVVTHVSPNSHSGGRKADPAPTPAPSPAVEVLQEIPFGMVEATGADEKATRAALTLNAARARTRAREACLKQFENVAGCIASKYEANSATLRNLDFATRKALQVAIVTDCEKRQGTCLEPAASEPACAELPKEVVPTPVEAEAKDDKKGKKKK